MGFYQKEQLIPLDFYRIYEGFQRALGIWCAFWLQFGANQCIKKKYIKNVSKATKYL
jgi:hypothetical protein